MDPRAPYGLDLVKSCLTCPARQSGLFCQLGAEALADLDDARQASVQPKGAVLFVAGQPPRGLFVLCQGRAKLTVTSKRGHSVILGIVGSGEVLGLAAVLSNTPYEAGAELLLPSEVDFIPRARFCSLIERHGEMKTRVAECLSLELRRARAQAARIALARTVRSRLAALLTDLGSVARRDGHGLRFQLGLTHEELAAFVGTSRETVTRLMNGFRRQGLIRVTGGLIVIPDPAKLGAIQE